MKVNDLPLRELFDKLRQAGFVLGIDEYELLLEALMKGFGIEDEAALKRLCKTLWVKSVEDEKIFNSYFEKVMSQPLENPLVTVEKPTPAKPAIPTTQPQVKQGKTTPTLPRNDERVSPDKLPPPEPRRDEPPQPPTQPSSEAEKSEPDESEFMLPEVAVEMDDEVQLLKTITSEQFFLYSDYLPLTKREMKQTWRYLRLPIREGPLVELDVTATIEKIIRDGFFLEPVLVPRRRNLVELVLLLDIDGSMVAFHPLGDRLKDTATRGGKLGASRVYYFHNCPVDYVYGKPGYSEAVRVEDMLSGLSANRACMLIFSDAGAARGGYSEDRLQLTERFLRQCQQHLRYLVWVNPVPRERWARSTAGEIAKLIPMLECDRLGLQNAVKVLRGNPVSQS
ncbi:MAG: CoxE [Limnospira sp. PMC 894.15]|uniref:CoxE n=1 Tax=unclassified Limnospira TaxID=2642885 RepID=UPI0028E0D331|nr:MULTISPECIES: CoxE [unclassified Limnospira]MDT9190134.1 CoxE [Limnospira sp. PMC 894.15]MDT9235091.1 CoxE [Limnospira sp. PMC 917.15]